MNSLTAKLFRRLAAGKLFKECRPRCACGKIYSVHLGQMKVNKSPLFAYKDLPVAGEGLTNGGPLIVNTT